MSVRAGSPVWQVAQEAAGMPEGHRVLVLPSDLGSFRVESAEVGAIVIAAYGHDVPACRAIGSATAFAQLIGSLLRPPTDDDLHQLIELVSHAAASVIEFSDEESALQMFDRARAGGQMLSIGESIAREELDRAGFHAVVRGARFDDEVVLWQTHLGNIIQIRGWMGDGYAGMAIEPRLRGFGLLSNG